MDYTIDAKNKRLGRLASEIAGILIGKKSVKYRPNKVTADRVLLVNGDTYTIGGTKATGKSKIYYHHTGYMGHLKELTFEQAFAKNPQKVLREAVKHMMPKNFLNQRRIKNLIFVENGKDGKEN